MKAGRWVKALWCWWILCGLTMGGLWLLATRNGLAQLSQERRQRLELALRRLQSKWTDLQALPVKVLGDRHVRPDRLGNFFKLYTPGQAPEWIQQLLRPRLQPTGLTQVRPRPPGLEAGRLDAPIPSDAPVSYWLIARPDGQVASLDLDYLYDRWLPHQLEEFGTDLKIRHLTPEETWSKPEDLVLTLFADDDYPFDGLILRLEDGSARMAFLGSQLLWLSLGGLVLLGFAAALRLAARGLRSEWDMLESRRHFNALVSHELRTPVSALRMYSEILQNELVQDREKIRNYHQIVASESARLQHLVENLLAIGSLESGRGHFEKLPVQLNEVIRSLVARQNWNVELQLDPNLPDVKGDREAMALIFGNLIENGRSHGGGQVQVHSKFEGGQTVVEVLDRGPGISPSDRHRVFEAYQRLERTGGQGVGLGLALVRGFVEAQSGHIVIRAREGGGAIFRVSFHAF